MKILVTGGAGFHGVNLCKALIDKDHKVTILSTPSPRSEENLKRFGLEDCPIIWGSITDSQLMTKAARGQDLVFHLAANIHVDESISDPSTYYHTNVIGTFNVAEACRNEGSSLIHVSTCEVYGDCETCDKSTECDHLISETCPVKPSSPYAASKSGAEAVVHSHAITYGTPTIIIRPGNVFGQGQRYGQRGAVIPIFTHLALQGKPLKIFGNGEQTRDFINIDSLVDVYTKLVSLGCLVTGQGPYTVNASSDMEVSINQVVEAIIKSTGSASPIEHVDARPGEVSGFRLETRKLRKLGLEPDYDFQHAINEYTTWFSENEQQ